MKRKVFSIQNRGGAMNLFEFQAKVDECRTPLEVQRVFHWYYERLVGTPRELMAAMDYADRRLQVVMDWSGATPHAGAFVPQEVAA